MRPNALAVRAIMETVSIHASVKDATSYGKKISGCFKVSIHASVKDATLTALAFVPLVTVSIHASVKDAT